MRRYLSKIIPIILVLACFGMSVYLDTPNKVQKYATEIMALNKLEDSCTTGEGRTRYVSVSADSTLNVRNYPSTDGSQVVNQYKRCTMVKVYCTNGDWAKISKTSNLWVHTDYLQSSLPSGCDSGAIATTTSKITFNLGSPNYRYAAGYDQMYSNKEGTITFNLSNVRNLADDDDEMINVTINKGNRDVTASFSIKKEYSSRNGTITLTQTNVNMESGSYTIKVKIGGSDTVQKSFNIVGKYYDFSINDGGSYMVPGMFGDSTAHSNIENEWRVAINNLVDATNYNAFTYKIEKVGTYYNTDATDKFNISRINDKLWSFKNKYDSKRSRPTAGTYRFILYYKDSEYSDARGEISDYWEFKVDERYVYFARNNIYSQRYTKVNNQYLYTIDISRLQTIDGTRYVEFTEDGTTKKMSETEFKKIYSDRDLTIINTDSSGYLTYVFSSDCVITNITKNHVTYTDSTGTSTKVQKEEFETLFPNAISTMESFGYTSSDEGYIHYTVSGTKTIVTKTLVAKNQNIYASTGGRIKFTYDYSYLNDEDFDAATIRIEREDGTEVGEEEDFYFSWEHDSTQVFMYLYYEGEDDAYVGNYIIYIDFEEARTQEVSFTLYDGDIDFYLQAQVDAHYETEDALETDNPPGNMNYEWYIGFYLMKSGKQVTSKNARMIDVDIYDHRADLDEEGHIYFYDQVPYEVYIQKYLSNEITYQVRENGSELTTVTEQFSDFAEKYTEAADMINMYNFDPTTGAIVSNNFELDVTRFYFESEDATDNTIVYNDASGNSASMPFAQFRVQYPDMFGYVVTRFVYDDDGFVIPGAITGNYRITKDENGNPLAGNNVNDWFDITIDSSAENVEKPITILPKTEVPAGQYFVYVTYDNLEGVGFVNNAPDAVISKELYPEMWNQNTHHTMITYIDPVYSLEIQNPELSNEGNDKEKIYANIPGTARFNVLYNFIHDLSGVSYKIEYNNGTNWEDATNKFTVRNSIVEGTEYYNIENPFIELTSIPENISEGTYRLTIDYAKGEFTATNSMEFVIEGKYYGLLLEDSEVAFIHNFQETKSVLAKGMYISNPENIEPSIVRLIGGDTEELIHEAAHQRFINTSGDVVFTYTTEVYEDYYQEEDTLLYEFLITNVSDVTDIGDYELTFTYQEGENDKSETVFDFIVGDDEYFFRITNETPVADLTGLYLYLDIETEHINYEDLDGFSYVIYMWDFNTMQDVDVSTMGVQRRMFTITDSWDASSGPNYKGKIKIKIDEDLVDYKGSYYITGYYEDTYRETSISDLESLFSWSIANYTVGSSYTEINADGEEEVIQLDSFYNNLTTGVIDVTLLSVYQSNVNWTINQNCISTAIEGSCSPTGINYNDLFTDNGNNSGETKRLTISMRDDLEETQRLDPGEYSLVLYYSQDNYRFLNFEVKNEYVDIQIGDPYVYSQINSDTIANGLYSNKQGYIHLPVKLRGIEYNPDLININVTNDNGDVNYNSYFSIKTSKFATDKYIEFQYSASKILPEGNYLITLEYYSNDDVIFDTYSFEIKKSYFNFNLSEVEYTPDKLYPNLENGGLAKFIVKVEDIPNAIYKAQSPDSETEKHVIAANVVITNQDGNDVTDQFTITAKNNANSIVNEDFDLNIEYSQNDVEPGYYEVSTHYELHGYVITRQQDFVIGDYIKDFKISRVEIITTTNDERIHKNIGGTYRVHLDTVFNLISENLNVKVTNSENEDVTNLFTIAHHGDYVDVKYVAVQPYINSGEYTITLTYDEDPTLEPYVTSTTVRMYATYKDILLKNLTASTDVIYADLEGQYYEFEVESKSMSTQDKNNLIFKVFDAEDNMVYSDLASDDIEPSFAVTNYINQSAGNVKLDILAFKARVGEYRVVAYLEDEDGEYNFSNSLNITIDYNYYKITLSNQSKITPVFTYNNDKESIYNIDGANAFFKFTSNYPAENNSVYSIKLYDGLKFKQEYLVNFEDIVDDGLDFIVTEFLTGPLDAANYDFAVCINGLPYVWLTKEIKEYIPVTKITMVIDGKTVEDNVKLFVGQTRSATVIYEPANATDTTFYFQAADPGIVGFDNTNHTITVYGVGTTEIVVSNSDAEARATITTDLRLDSTKYVVDYDNYQIYVNKMTTKSLAFDTFIGNLTGLADDYKILDKSKNDVTETVTKVTTGMSIVNGNETYDIVIIGDLNKDGNINVYDVTMLYQYIRGKTKINDKNVLLAAKVRRNTTINVYDVTKLYQFVRNKIKTL